MIKKRRKIKTIYVEEFCCPECGAAMKEEDFVYTCLPPKYSYKCSECDYQEISSETPQTFYEYDSGKKVYRILALCGEAGSGKDTMMQEVLKLRPDLHEIVSCTTRPMREGEQEGVNYHYYTPTDFQEKIVKNEMLEHTVFNNWYYGTGYASLDANAINIGVFNPEGIRQLSKRDDVELITVYVRRPAKLRLLGQLKREDNPDVSEIIRRAAADEKDFANLDFYHYTVPNEIYEDLVMGPQHIVSLLDEFK